MKMTALQLAAAIQEHFADATEWNGFDDGGIYFSIGNTEVGFIEPNGNIMRDGLHHALTEKA